MQRFYIEIGEQDNGQQARLLHKEDCQKLKNPEHAVSLSKSPTFSRALEEAQRLFSDTLKCPNCATSE
ncbi:hypothetical protein LG288_10025 [Idiomarina seosinensis]|uniref:hypothetical protein n=1 Tax=Idiomarina seosinensis TaxID=281739 RepID=UPI00384DFB1F